MANISDFCTCADLGCSLHPTNHEKGCSLCIMKNLKTREIPSCFFNLLHGAEARKGDTLTDFADLVSRQGENK